MSSRRSSTAFSDAEVEALLSGRAVADDDLRELFGLLRTAATVPAPTPTSALAAVLLDGFAPLPVAPAPGASGWQRWSLRIAAVTAATLTATIGAATANALPAPVQTAVADIVGAVTPLQLPRPPGQAPSGSQPVRLPDREVSGPEGTTASEPAGPDAPAPAPLQRPRATAPTSDDDRDTDEPAEADEREGDAPDLEGADAGEPGTEQPGTDTSSPENAAAESEISEAPQAGDGDAPSEEPEPDVEPAPGPEPDLDAASTSD